MNLELFTATMVTINVALAALASWQRHQTVSEVIRRRRKRQNKKAGK